MGLYTITINLSNISSGFVGPPVRGVDVGVGGGGVGVGVGVGKGVGVVGIPPPGLITTPAVTQSMFPERVWFSVSPPKVVLTLSWI